LQSNEKRQIILVFEHNNGMQNTLSDKPLEGLKVIELHAIGPVPFAGRLLQDLGATVTRISPPNDPGLGVAMDKNFDFLNIGKPVVKLDLKASKDHEQLLAQLAQADVLLEGFRPGVLERLNLAPEQLLASYPKLVIGRLSGWGSQGDLAARAGHDINYLAMSGLLNAIGKADSPHPPVNVVADFGGGAMHLVVGVLALLARRGITQKGGIAQTSILAGTVGLTPMFYGLLASGVWNLQRENNLLDGKLPFYCVYPTKDQKFVAVGALEAKFYAELLKLTGLAETLEPKHQYKASTWQSTKEKFAEVFVSKTRDEWAQLALNTDACVSPVLDFVEAAAHPHNQANHLHQKRDTHTDAGQIISFS
jgi:alpha-methylacyl-CoA racemase